jgi:hypothetical protein
MLLNIFAEAEIITGQTSPFEKREMRDEIFTSVESCNRKNRRSPHRRGRNPEHHATNNFTGAEIITGQTSPLEKHEMREGFSSPLSYYSQQSRHINSGSSAGLPKSGVYLSLTRSLIKDKSTTWLIFLSGWSTGMILS